MTEPKSDTFGTVYTVPANDYFGLLEGPFEREQHPNEQCGLDLYVRVIHLRTGEHCLKKLYRSKRGLYFIHKGYSSSYLDEMTRTVSFCDYQYIFADGE